MFTEDGGRLKSITHEELPLFTLNDFINILNLNNAIIILNVCNKPEAKPEVKPEAKTE